MIHRANNTRLTAPAIAILYLLFLLQPGTARAVSVGQIDDFEDGTLQGWMMGANNITATHMTNITVGGPAGVDDNFLQVVSHEAEATGGGRLTLFISPALARSPAV